MLKIIQFFAGNKNLGPYTLPLLVWYAMQFILGTALTPRLKAFVETETKRLGTVNENPEAADVEAVIEIPGAVEPAGLEGEAAQAIDAEKLITKA